MRIGRNLNNLGWVEARAVLSSLYSLLHFIVFASAIALSPAAVNAAANVPLALVRDIPLPGGISRFDYQSLDTQSGVLFIAHLGASQVLAFDTKTQRVIANIKGISHVHGVLAVPALERVYASATGAHEIVAIDENALQPVAKLPGGEYPDGLSYSPETGELFVSDEFGQALIIIDTQARRRPGTLNLGGEVGNNQYDTVTHHVFANVQTLAQLVEIDPASRRIVQRYPLSHCSSNHGLLIAPDKRLAFIACEGNARLLVWDMRRMRVIQEEAVGEAPDVLAYDAGLDRLYVASESGVVSVFRVDAASISKQGESLVAAKAHSIAVDPGSHLVYLPLENVDGHPVLRIMKPD